MSKKDVRLHGWDDEKIYLLVGNKEYCVSDNKELLTLLRDISVRFMEVQKSQKEKTKRKIQVFCIKTTEEKMWTPGHLAPFETTYFYIPSKKIAFEKCSSFHIHADNEMLRQIREYVKRPPNDTTFKRIKIEQSKVDYLLTYYNLVKGFDNQRIKWKKKFEEDCQKILKGLNSK